MRARTWIGVAVLGAATSCLEPLKPCGVENCHGCCDAWGDCYPGESSLSCGGGGELCHACGEGEVCEVNSAGTAGACIPDPSLSSQLPPSSQPTHDAGLDCGDEPDAGSPDLLADCAGATPVALDGGAQLLTAEQLHLASDGVRVCAWCGYSGTVAVWTFTVAAAAMVSATVVSPEPLALELRASCPDWASYIACSPLSPSGLGLGVPVGPGQYFLWAERLASIAGPMQLQLEVR